MNLSKAPAAQLGVWKGLRSELKTKVTLSNFGIRRKGKEKQFPIIERDHLVRVCLTSR